MSEQQLQLLPEQPVSPEIRQVSVKELPEQLPGSEPGKAFIQSVEKFGILQPVGLIESNFGYHVAFGRRRIKAARLLELDSIPAHIYPADWTPTEVLTLVENQQRRDNLAAKLEAIASLRLKATMNEICLAVGVTKTELRSAIRLIDGLIPELRLALAEGRMTASTAQKAVRLAPEQQQTLAEFETIKGKDVEHLLRVNSSASFGKLPDSLFEEVPPTQWQDRAENLVTQLLEIVPSESRYYAQVLELATTLKVQQETSKCLC